MKTAGDHAIILFDGVCNFCNYWVNFTIRHDKKDYFRFAPLQSDTGSHLLKKNNLPENSLESFILIENGKAYYMSTAALRVAKKLNALYPLCFGFIIVPKFIRDGVYRWIAKNRYRWYGKRDSCMVPDEKLRSKFI